MTTLLDAIGTASWAMTPEALQQIYDIAARENELTPEALAKMQANELARSERALQRGSVAIIPIEGPLFKKANLFVRISGATSYEIVRRDLQAALDNPAITSILLQVDSPGGEAWGADELAKAIFAARSQKRIVAYVGSQACSAGYWLASAAHEIVMSDLSIVGSIGAVISVNDTGERDAKSGVRRLTFVSSQSPNKVPDLNTESGKSQIQTFLDDTAQVFIEAVAKHRGVKVDTVLADFGQGGVTIASKAVALGMADRIGTFEGVIDDLNSRGTSGRVPPRSQGGFHMTTTANGPVAENTGISAEAHTKAVNDARAEAAASAQARIAGIISSDEGKANPKLAEHLAFKTGMSVDDAKATLSAAALDYKAIEASANTLKPEAPKQTFIEQRASADGLAIVGGVNAPKSDASNVKANWSKAVKAASSHLNVN